MKEIYLDNISTTRPREEVIDKIISVLKFQYGNPSSLHRKGLEAEKIVSEAREKIAHLLQVKPKEIIFTSGGTESNNLAIKGVAYSREQLGRHIITSSIEHPSVLETCKQLEKDGFSVSYLPVDKNGVVDVEELLSLINENTILVSVMYVNNEVGSIQPIERIAQIVKNHKKAVFHVDSVQAFGKIQLLPRLDGIHLLSLSSHKIYGPKGVGALFVHEGLYLHPLLCGGGQEYGLRSGTENTPGIAGFGTAAELVMKNFEDWTAKMRLLKEHLKNGIISEIEDVLINSPENSAPHILNISFLGVKAEILLHSLEEYGIFVSTKSACVTKKGNPSYVLAAMKRKRKEIESALRFGLSPFLTLQDIDFTVDVLKKEVKSLRILRS